MIFIVGIDPGINGGWCKVTESGQVIDYGNLHHQKLGQYKIPDLHTLMMTWYDAVKIVVEEQQGLPGNPIGSLSQQCTGYGAILGQLLMHPFGFNVEPVKPAQWTGDLVRAGFGRPKSVTGVKVTRQEEFRRAAGLLDVRHDGVLDAAGIALWKAWTLSGVLRARRMEKAKRQGLVSLADSWIDGDDD